MLKTRGQRAGGPWLTVHVLGISGGKDSAALAVFMRLRHAEIGHPVLLH